MAKYNPYESLAVEEVCEILFGQRDFGQYRDDEKDLTYRVGLEKMSRGRLINLCHRFRMTDRDMFVRMPYSDPGQVSPEDVPVEVYQLILMKWCVEDGTCPVLLKLLFRRDLFCCPQCGEKNEADDETYALLVNRIIDGINLELEYSRTEMALTKDGVVVRDKDAGFVPVVPNFETENLNAKKRCEEAMSALAEGDFDHAILLSGTILESTIGHALRMNGIKPNENGLSDMFGKQFVKKITLSDDPNTDQRIKKLLEGIVTPLTRTRNNNGDGHDTGVDIPADESHARLCVNMSISVSEYIMSMLPIVS